ncbi:PREDICTED: uncharacterized protein LOC109208062 isoform X1 [Nicotiana attenuata]|uniref:Uncharacterized protein n=1 Tax=Nicotiana attenuata TaxID=49451 RepID=A0A314KR48_NICAT|nr:PREDICTED: uncharacterized protein LOC109208062 isoform X1 [Nicotiana attenuata]OIT31921.1 hypothetical protein A4A49_18830 [Nicotiana attenuata]
MDLAENQEKVEEKKKEEIREPTRLRRLLGILFFLFAFFSLSFSLLYLAVFLGNLSISSPISLPSQCKIVSSSVDLRSSKVCELGLLNYKAKHVLYPSERKKFRCRYDYYWASVFKVEYMDHSGQARLALAEAPNEALPSDCRPNFSTAWLTKDKFKVNKTYECWYTLGISKVHIYEDGFFDCQAKDPSTIEMFIRYLILFMRILKSWYVSGASAWHWRWEAVAGVIAGFCTSMISIVFFALLQRLISRIYQLSVTRRLTLSLNKVRLKRVCFLLAYVSFSSWLAIQYFRRIGLPEIAVHYSM